MKQIHMKPINYRNANTRLGCCNDNGEYNFEYVGSGEGNTELGSDEWFVQ